MPNTGLHSIGLTSELNVAYGYTVDSVLSSPSPFFYGIAGDGVGLRAIWSRGPWGRPYRHMDTHTWVERERIESKIKGEHML